MDAHACPLKFGSCKSHKHLLLTALFLCKSFKGTKMPPFCEECWGEAVLATTAAMYPNNSRKTVSSAPCIQPLAKNLEQKWPGRCALNHRIQGWGFVAAACMRGVFSAI